MLTTFAVPAVLAGITFIIYSFGVRAGCRWTAWLAALLVAGASFLILALFSRGLTAGVLLESLVAVMAGTSLITRQRFGRQEAGRRSHYRVHRLKRSLF